MEGNVAAEIFSVRRKFRQSPSKASQPGFFSWKDALLIQDATDSRHGMLDQVKAWNRKDD